MWPAPDMKSNLLPEPKSLPPPWAPEQAFEVLKMAGALLWVFAMFGDPSSSPSSLHSHASISFWGFTFPNGIQFPLGGVSLSCFRHSRNDLMGFLLVSVSPKVDCILVLS